MRFSSIRLGFDWRWSRWFGDCLTWVCFGYGTGLGWSRVISFSVYSGSSSALFGSG
ncbi:hypothetical protein HanIR_Chr17g0884761 [Helianthus annuus]|nr:hypothetical protein HanIR_Chr17g0884761 [Helianthus annuus]